MRNNRFLIVPLVLLSLMLCFVAADPQGVAVYGKVKAGTEFSLDVLTFRVTEAPTKTANGQAEIIGNTLGKKTRSIELPSSVEYEGRVYDITGIGDYAFLFSKLETVILPDSVIAVGEGAFAVSPSLREVSFGKGVGQIVANAFSYCDSLENLVFPEENSAFISEYGAVYNKKQTILYMAPAVSGIIAIPDSVKQINAGAFEGNSRIVEVFIPAGVKRIDANTFLNCSALECVHIPVSVSKISGNPFAGCPKLTTFDLDPDNHSFTVNDAMLLSAKGGTILSYPSAAGALVVPENIKVIGDYAFAGASGLTKVTLNKTVKTVGKGAFANCRNLSRVNIEKRTVAISSDIVKEEEKVFYNAAAHLVVRVPFSDKAGEDGSIESLIRLNSPSTVIIINK